ncbi:hypothetical protein [Nocardiopsis eucommiae]|uniref:hypothetical protein n=1 Tax=Nocardiopsis eucommiae TaxID=2831970 RepID=UPI003D70E468
MPGHELGVNVQDAFGAGVNAEGYAASFEDLHSDFKDLLDAAKAACKDEPEVTGWASYGEDQAESIAEVEHHGVSLAENIQSGASEAANTDSQAGETFGTVEVPSGLPGTYH